MATELAGGWIKADGGRIPRKDGVFAVRREGDPKTYMAKISSVKGYAKWEEELRTTRIAADACQRVVRPIDFFDFEQPKGTRRGCFVMEMAVGSLRDLGSPGPVAAFRAVTDLCDIVTTLHRAGITHNDVYDRNLMLVVREKGNVVCLADWDRARAITIVPGAVDVNFDRRRMLDIRQVVNFALKYVERACVGRDERPILEAFSYFCREEYGRITEHTTLFSMKCFVERTIAANKSTN